MADQRPRNPIVQERLDRDFTHPVISPLFDALTNTGGLPADEFARIQRLYLSLLISDHQYGNYVHGRYTLRRKDHLKTLGVSGSQSGGGSSGPQSGSAAGTIPIIGGGAGSASATTTTGGGGGGSGRGRK